MTPAPTISVLIVTWNCAQLIGECLDHLFASVIDVPIEVIVVDNRSTDETVAILKGRAEPIIIVEPGENLGFARGNNLAAANARGRYLLLLNPDAYLTDHKALARLFATIRAGDERVLGGVAPRLNNPDGTHQIGDGGYAPTPGNIVRHVGLISRMFPAARGFYVNHPRLMRQNRIALDWLAATCLLVTRTAFDAVNGFDPRFFMYGEDVDLGLRMTRAGYRLELLPQVSVVHLQGGTQRSNPDDIHVSTGWIDAIFASHQDSGFATTASRYVIAGTMLLGFSARSLAYLPRGGRGRKRARAMLCYARHGWAGRHSIISRTHP